jgi:carboxypeptidase C (cathepsin A)
MPYRDYGQYGTFGGHQLLPKPMWDQYMSNDCKDNEGKPVCQSLTNHFDALTQDMDPYALDFPVCQSSAATGRHERFSLMSAIRRARRATTGALGSYFPDEYEPCSDVYANDYLNRADVQAAIHAVPVEWSECSNTINQNWNVSDLAAPMMPVYEFLIQHGNLNIMIYSGNDDSVCATLGSQQFIWDTFSSVPTDSWRSWKVENQVAGFTQGFKGNFRFTTVNGAGHMVPSTRPAEALDMIKNYLAEKW